MLFCSQRQPLPHGNVVWGTDEGAGGTLERPFKYGASIRDQMIRGEPTPEERADGGALRLIVGAAVTKRKGGPKASVEFDRGMDDSLADDRGSVG
jgi:hypothetical protein